MSVSPLPNTTVRVEGAQVVFDGFIEDDRHVVDLLSAAVDPEGSAHNVLHLGAHLAGLAAGTGGLAELENRVGTRLDSLADATQTTVTTGLTALADQSRALLAADDGEVAILLNRWRAELDTHLGELFDPDYKRSLISVMERALSGVLEGYARRLVSATDPDVPDSAAGRLVAQVQANNADLKAELAALTLAVGAERGRVTEHSRTAVKGLEFEPTVLAVVTGIAAPHGDMVEHVGRATGTRGTRKGDIRVALAIDDIGPSEGAYIIEAKDRRLTLDSTWRELDAAMGNWDAGAAVAVFAGGDLAPTELPFWYSGEKAIVVLDREDPDPAPLALACLFARWVVRRRMAPGRGAPDPERVIAIIERIQRTLARVSTIRRHLSSSARANDDARTEVDELASEIRDALAELSGEVGR